LSPAAQLGSFSNFKLGFPHRYLLSFPVIVQQGQWKRGRQTLSITLSRAEPFFTAHGQGQMNKCGTREFEDAQRLGFKIRT
jgi:hypothetical protein